MTFSYTSSSAFTAALRGSASLKRARNSTRRWLRRVSLAAISSSDMLLRSFWHPASPIVAYVYFPADATADSATLNVITAPDAQKRNSIIDCSFTASWEIHYECSGKPNVQALRNAAKASKASFVCPIVQGFNAPPTYFATMRQAALLHRSSVLIPYRFFGAIRKNVHEMVFGPLAYYRESPLPTGVWFPRTWLLNSDPELEFSEIALAAAATSRVKRLSHAYVGHGALSTQSNGIYSQSTLHWSSLLPCGFDLNLVTFALLVIRSARSTQLQPDRILALSAQKAREIATVLSQTPEPIRKAIHNDFPIEFTILKYLGNLSDDCVVKCTDTLLKDLTSCYVTVRASNTPNNHSLELINTLEGTVSITREYFRYGFGPFPNHARSAHYDSRITPDSTIIVFDRPDQAGDNGEAFYRFLAESYPEFDEVYFALSRSSEDWARLEAEQFKLIEVFSDEFYKKFEQSDAVISSQMTPIATKTKNFQNSRFIYLQHGIQLNDMTSWIIPKRFDVFVTTGRNETEYMQRIAPVETLNSGLPRLATLPQERRTYGTPSFAGNRGRVLVFMPTWQVALHNLSDEEYKASAFFSMVSKLLQDSRLNQYLVETDSVLAMKLHPNANDRVHLFPWSERAFPTFASYSEIYSDADVLITDYSSSVLDGAFLGIPIAYLQINSEDFFRDQVYEPRIDYKTEGVGFWTDNVDELIEYLLEEKYARPPANKAGLPHKFFSGVECDRINERIVERMFKL